MEKALTDWKQLHGDTFRNSRVLVTGGAGFIGSHLCEALSSLGAMVVVLDDFSGGSDENLRGIPRVQVIRGSVLDQKRVEQAMQACRWVFHQAALGSVPQSVRQ